MNGNRNMKKALFVLFAVTFLSACGSLAPSTNYKQLSRNLTVGMTKQQVIAVLGTPKSKKINGKKEEYKYNSRGAYQEIYYYSPIPLPYQEISNLDAYFDENGLLESFYAY